jgi:hypothetical protein
MSADQLRVPRIAGPAVPGQASGRSVRALLSDLFPAPAEPSAQPTPAARLAFLAIQVAALAAGTALLLVRVSGRPAWDGVNTEDVDVFLAQALAHPWHLQSYGGYLELAPRLIGQVVALLPIRYAAAGFAVSGALVASGCGLLAYHASAALIGSRWLRVLLGLSVLLLPVAQLEIADNGVNTPFYLLVALFWAILWRPRSRAGASVAAVVAFVTVASNPLAVLFAPLLLARAAVVPRRIREQAVTAGWAIGCLLQVPFVVTSHVSRTAHAAPANSVTYLARDVTAPALGWHLAWQLRAAFGPDGATLIVGGVVAVILGLAVFTQARRYRVFVVTAVATGLVFTFVAATLSWVPSQRVTLGMEPGARYSTLPILLLDAAMIVSADACLRRWGSRTWAMYAVAGLVAVLAVGWVSDFRYPVSHNSGPAWALTANTWLRHCQQAPGKSITVTSGAWFGKAPVTTFSCSSLRR